MVSLRPVALGLWHYIFWGGTHPMLLRGGETLDAKCCERWLEVGFCSCCFVQVHGGKTTASRCCELQCRDESFGSFASKLLTFEIERRQEWMVFLPLLLKIKDIVRILRNRNRGIDHKIERTLAKTDWHETLCHFSTSWENRYHCFLFMCSGQPAFLLFTCIVQDLRTGRGCCSWCKRCLRPTLQFFSFFRIWAISIPHPAVDLYDNFNCCWWIYQTFLLFRSRWGCQIMIQPSIVTFNTAMASPWEARLTRAPWSSRFPPWFFEEASQIPSQATLCLLEQLTTIALQPNQISSLESVKEITYN